jgi:hypothetical protein
MAAPEYPYRYCAWPVRFWQVKERSCIAEQLPLFTDNDGAPEASWEDTETAVVVTISAGSGAPVVHVCHIDFSYEGVMHTMKVTINP